MDSDSSSRRTEVAIESGPWHETIAEVEQFCERIVGTVLAVQAPALAERAEVSILLTDDAAIRELNGRWRGRDRATNVLSFPAMDDPGSYRDVGGAPPQLGDVVLAFETLTREAREQGRPTRDHFCHLLVHGTLHLLGLDHAETSEAEAMERREVEVLARLGVADPYREEEVAA
jgi:probable rRNA maturation factor